MIYIKKSSLNYITQTIKFAEAINMLLIRHKLFYII